MNKLKTTFIISVILIFILLFVSSYQVPQEPLEGLNEKQKGDIIKLSGEILEKTEGPKYIQLKIKESPIKIILFVNKKQIDKIELDRGQKIEVVGKLDFYKNKPEVIADKINLIE